MDANPGDSENLLRPADHWRLGTSTLHFGRLPLVMGILNVTPDSFSDGGAYFDPPAAIEHGMRLAAEGADIIDVGGQSTRPYSSPIDVQEELRRVVPVVAELCRRTSVPVSVDTSKAAVAREALDAGAEIINDVTGLQHDARMLPLAVETGAGVCVMHARGTPRSMQVDPTYNDVVVEVIEYLRDRRDTLVAAGVLQDRIVLDPGMGFGKSLQHNLELLLNARRLHSLGCPVLIGHSRKAFIGGVLGDKEADREAGTIGVALAMARQEIQILRVHNVAAVRGALRLFEASGGMIV